MKTLTTPELALSPEIEAMLAAVRPHTQGKRILILGGEPRPDKIARFMAAPPARPPGLARPQPQERRRGLRRPDRAGGPGPALQRVHGPPPLRRPPVAQVSTPMVRVTGSFGVVRIIQALHQFLLGKDLTNDHARARGVGRVGPAEKAPGGNCHVPAAPPEDEAPGRQPPDQGGMGHLPWPPLRWGVRRRLLFQHPARAHALPLRPGSLRGELPPGAMRTEAQ